MIFTVALKKNNEFIHVYKNGRHYAGKHLYLYMLKGNPDAAALGVVASKKTGKSVRRNRLKRLIKENYRFYEEYIRRGFMFIFVVKARQDMHMPEYDEINREMKSLLLRAGAFDQQKWEDSRDKA